MKTETPRWALPAAVALLMGTMPLSAQDYPVVDTGQEACYDDSGQEIACPVAGEQFNGQDAQYDGHLPSYTLSQDGLTVRDNVSGLTWQQSPDTDGDGDIDADDKLSWVELNAYPATLNSKLFGGFDDWRVPTIKELYSLIDFSGTDPSGCESEVACPDIVPFIDTDYFAFGYGDTASGERLIDAQFWSSTEYVSTTMGGAATAFGVNLADGRIKGYPRDSGPSGTQTQYALLVRGNTDYGVNDCADNGDGSVTDLATGLVWQQSDDGVGRNWKAALAYSENLTLAGCDDWRLPNAKELQSILDYTRAPAATGSAAIDPVFGVSPIVDEGGGTDYPSYWSSTTHVNWTANPGLWAAYVCFGECLGWMFQPFPPPGGYELQDVHGAGAQRSDPKSGDPADWPNGHGPQGDVIRIYNHVRAVRGEPVGACEIRVDGADSTLLGFYPSCPAQSFEVVTGLLAELRIDGDFSRASCLGTFDGEANDPGVDPSPGEGFYYLAKGQEACASRGYGAANGVTPDPRDDLDAFGPCS